MTSLGRPVRSSISEVGCKLPGSIDDAVPCIHEADVTPSLFNECLQLCKRELRSLSQNLRDEAIASVRKEVHQILSDACIQNGRSGSNDAKDISSSYWTRQTTDVSHETCEELRLEPMDSVHQPRNAEAGAKAISQNGWMLEHQEIIHHSTSRASSSDGVRESKSRSRRLTSMSAITQDTETGRGAARKAWARSYSGTYRSSSKQKEREKEKEKEEEKEQDVRSSNRSSVQVVDLSNIREKLVSLTTNSMEANKNSLIARTVTSDAFDYVFGLVLVLNAIAMGVQVDWEAMHLGEKDPPIFAITDLFFCVAFMVELGLRLQVFKLAFYFMPGWQWAYFDTVIVVMQAFEEIMKLVALVSNQGEDAQDERGGQFRVLKLLKIGRLLRMVRMVRLIPELKSMVYLIFASMSSFFWSCVLLCIMIYSIAVYLTMMATDVRLDGARNATNVRLDDSDKSSDLADVHQYWGSLGDSIMSLYWAITGGQDWADLIHPLIVATGNQFHNIIFAMYIAFATMVVMNLVTGVFVEGAQRLSKEDKDRELIKIAQKTFNVVDDDENVAISKEELSHHMKTGSMDPYLEAINLQRQDCLDLFELLDVDGSGTISLTEFTHGCLKLRGQARAADVAQLLLDVRSVRQEVITEMGEKLDSVTEICRSIAERISFEARRDSDVFRRTRQ